MAEIDIIWLDNPLKYTYLRESCYSTTKPRMIRKKMHRSRLIGYSVHKADGSRYYPRRIWTLNDWDRDLEPTGVYADDCPWEAVLPSSIQAGKPSLRYWPVMMRAKGYDVADQLWHD